MALYLFLFTACILDLFKLTATLFEDRIVIAWLYVLKLFATLSGTVKKLQI